MFSPGSLVRLATDLDFDLIPVSLSKNPEHGTWAKNVTDVTQVYCNEVLLVIGSQQVRFPGFGDHPFTVLNLLTSSSIVGWALSDYFELVA